MPTREVLWNIDHAWLMYVLLVPTLAIATFGCVSRIRVWRRGRPEARFDRPWQRLSNVWTMAVAHRGIRWDPIAGIIHALLAGGFVILFIATVVVLMHHDFAVPVMQGNFYLYFQSFFVDCMGAAALLASLAFAIRRYRKMPSRLRFDIESQALLLLLIVIFLSGFLIEGWRIAVTDDPWGAWSPIGYLVARFSRVLASNESMQMAHVVLWWAHLVLVYGLIAWTPYTKLFHVVTATLNLYCSNLDAPCGKLKTIDFETAETFGVAKAEHFTWKDLLDLDACTECGRCTDVCPAHVSGKDLSPRDLILDLQRLCAPSRDSCNEATLVQSDRATSAASLWQCTTCAACVDACPVAIEPYPKIVDLRRYLVMEAADIPRPLQEAVNSLEQRGHPFRGSQASRTDWTEGVTAPHFEDVDHPEVLLWVGCGGALVERNQRTTRAIAQLLAQANVRFGILGRDESCSGDPARRIGNEFLFETLAKQNIETINNKAPQAIVTSCPHCFNSFKNEYPDLGGAWDVYHHTTYLAKLIGENRLQVQANVTDKLTYHDPCYLGRHNRVTIEPRQLLEKVATEPIVEMARHGLQSFCCGAGGGMSFMDEAADQRVNVERAKEAIATGADTVAVACPFCSTMMEDGMGAAQMKRNVNVRDVAELLWDSVQQQDRS